MTAAVRYELISRQIAKHSAGQNVTVATYWVDVPLRAAFPRRDLVADRQND